MVRKKHVHPPKPVWAYAYELVPPQGEDRLKPIQSVLDREHKEARRESRTWASSVVVESQVTHILVVSDSPLQDLAINKALEAKLKELKAVFSITTPMIVAANPEDGA